VFKAEVGVGEGEDFSVGFVLAELFDHIAFGGEVHSHFFYCVDRSFE